MTEDSVSPIADLLMEQLEAEPVVSEPGLNIQPADIEGVEKAHLPVALTVDPYCLFIRHGVEKCESRPVDADHRLEKRFFVWMVFTAATHPRATIGVQGDLWIDNTPGARNIYFRGRSGKWVPWNIHHNHDACHSDHDGDEIAHPWLPKRCLQFTGFDIGWCAHGLSDVHRQRWNDSCASSDGPGSYDKLSIQHMIDLREMYKRSSMSLRRIIEPTSPIFPPQSSRSRISRMPPRSAASCTSSMPSPSGAHSSPATPHPPSVTVGTQTDTYVGRSNVHVNHPPADGQETLPLKRGLSPLFESLEREHAFKRAKGEVKGKGGDLASASTSPSAFCTGGAQHENKVAHEPSIAAFLGDLPLKLSHRLDMFTALGITSHAHLEALALLPRQLQEELYKELQKRGLPLIEALVLRSAFNALCDSAPPHVKPATGFGQADSMDKFLARMRPSMMHHLRAFQELGVHSEHLPVLAGLDAGTYGVFEGELRKHNFTWVELLLLKASIGEVPKV
ncbi:hypothetical protein BV20DRAFT_1021727 [Pilatotrama ljubarskyi]|nr:hypothetical protein BV20DRAFT_1021727 [Pilatotrama ljubarskyi]